MTNRRILKAQKIKYLYCPHKIGVGMQFIDSRYIDRPYDIGEARCYDGKYIISWGLNLAEENLRDDESYVMVGYVTDGSGQRRKNYEKMIAIVPA